MRTVFCVCADYLEDLEVAVNICNFLDILGFDCRLVLRMGEMECLLDQLLDRLRKKRDDEFENFLKENFNADCLVMVCIFRDNKLKDYASYIQLKDNKLHLIRINRAKLKDKYLSLLPSVILHELLHLERREECSEKNKLCIGAKVSRKSQFYLCPKCKEVLTKVIEKFGNPKNSKLFELGE